MNISSRDDISHFPDPARPSLCSLVLVMGVDPERPAHLGVLHLAVGTGVERERRYGVRSAGVLDAFLFLSGWMPKAKMLDWTLN